MTVTMITLSKEHLDAIKDKRQALNVCIRIADLPPKAVAATLGLDRSHLTKMITDTADPRHFPPELELELMQLCRNTVPLDWTLNRLGLPTVQEIQEMQAELEQRRMDSRAVTNVFKFIGDDHE